MGFDAFPEVDWDEVPLSELTSANVTYGVVQPGSPVSDGVPMIRVKNFNSHTLNLNEVIRISHDVERKYERTRVRAGDVLITVVGSVGQVAIVPPELTGWNIARAVALIRPKSPDLARWIAYFLRSPIAQHRMGIAANTTVQTTVNLKDLRTMPIPMPPETVRQGITDLLSALDDRIDLLRQTNTTLEAIAQALFKSWFVDFDPVHAKAEGRDPEAMDAATATLFPSEFEQSELGPIPKGWHVAKVGEIALLVKGRSYKSTELDSSDTALVTLKSFNRGGGFRRDGFKPYTGTYKEEQIVHEGDCIVAFTDVTQQAELIGRTAIVTGTDEYRQLVASLDVGILCSKVASVSPAFLRALLSGDRYVGHIKGYTTGTTVLHLAKDGLPSYPFVMPPDELISRWSEIGGACIDQQALNVRKMDALAKLRDTLLPRLISGKLRLPEAEAVIEDVMA